MKRIYLCFVADTKHSDSTGWIEIFRAGDYRPQGKAQITRSDLERVIRNYDPSYHEAPVCIGHPENNLPAYGWIERLALNGDTLLAKEKQVDPKFDEARRAGRFKKRSAAFYQDAAGRVSGLRHVAWLGAQPPEVKGLQDVKFDDGGRSFIELEFGEEESVAVETEAIDNRIEAWFKKLFAKPEGDVTKFSEADVKRIAGAAVAEATAPLTSKITALEESLKQQTAVFSERENKIVTAEVKQRGVDAITKLKSAGKWIPAFDRAGLSLVFDELAKTTQTVEFGEGDAKKAATPLELLVQFMESLPKIVPAGTKFEGATATVPNAGAKSDPLTEAARARQKEKNLTFSEALDQVAQEHPELTRPGVGGAGAV